MRVLVTGSAGHLGEALMREMRVSHPEYDVLGLDILPSNFTTHVGTITDRAFVRKCMEGVAIVYHTATLHKPHVATHTKQAFIDTNITGTLNLLEEAAAANVQSFVFTSTTSVFGDSLVPPDGAPAAWITEEVVPTPKNIYGVTKLAAEDLCQLFHRNHGLAVIILRTSRFFPEDDDSAVMCEQFSSDNLKAIEYLNRRVEIRDVTSAHFLAAEKAPKIGFGKYIVSATTPFVESDAPVLRANAAAVLERYCPSYRSVFENKGWKMLPSLDRVYCNAKARRDLGWRPVYDFQRVVSLLQEGGCVTSELAALIGRKYYHRAINES